MKIPIPIYGSVRATTVSFIVQLWKRRPRIHHYLILYYIRFFIIIIFFYE